MNIILSMSGKLLCNIGYHKLTTVLVITNPTFPLVEVEERKCSRCGFSYRTGKIVHR